MVKRKEEITLKDLVNIFIPKIWVIIIAALVIGVGATIYAALIKDESYTSNTQVNVINAQNGDNYNTNDITFVSKVIEDYKTVLKISDTIVKIMDDVKNSSTYGAMYLEKGWGDLTVKQVNSYISVTTNNTILSVSVTTGDPTLSCAIATSVANVVDEGGLLAYPESMVKTKIVEVAKPGTQNSRKVLTFALIGVLAGAFISMVVIFVFNMFDVVIHDKKKIEGNLELPILGVIPRYVSEEAKAKK